MRCTSCNSELIAGKSFCHACGAPLILRDWYELTGWNLDAEGRCPRCQSPCAGIFEARPGRWGSRRQPVRIADFGGAG